MNNSIVAAANAPVSMNESELQIHTSGIKRKVTADVRVVWTLFLREFLKLKAEKFRVAGMVLQPLLLWLVFSFGFDQGFGARAANVLSFREFFLPGVFLMTVLFGCVFSSMTIIDDRNNGFLQSALVTPASRVAVAFGKSIGVIAVTLVQCGIVVFGSAMFLSGSGNWSLVSLFGWMFLASFALVPLNLAVALYLNSTHSYHSFMGAILLPLWALSGALFPVENPWLASVAMLNPLSYIIEGFQFALGFAAPAEKVALQNEASLLLKVGFLIALGFCGLYLSLIAMRRSARAS